MRAIAIQTACDDRLLFIAFGNTSSCCFFLHRTLDINQLIMQYIQLL